MKTRIIHVNPRDFKSEELAEAAGIIRNGGLVAFPTETVYGLGANALDAEAVARIYLAKGRPSDNPLIVHIADKADVDWIAGNVSADAKTLMDEFWPGSLTLVMKKKTAVPDAVTCGLDTVAVRMPRSEVALELIRQAGVPVAAPSANRSGRPSPTDADHVIEDFDGRIDYIIDAGKVDVGVESTVLDMTSPAPVILRPGGVTFEMLSQVLPEVLNFSVNAGTGEETPRSPGVKYTHYSPKAKVIVVTGGIDGITKRVNKIAGEYSKKGMKAGVLVTDETIGRYEKLPGMIIISAGSRKNPETIAASLFGALRRFDTLGVDVIFAEGIDTADIGSAIMNRLEKAAGYDIINTEKDGE